MSITSLFPEAAGSPNPAQEAFEREVAARFGLLPNFFRSAPDAPFVVHELWRFAKAAYLDAPIPTLLKERLFVYLSRFCDVRYCITRHCGFLLGLGRAAGDPDAQAMTIAQVIRLLQRPVPNDACASGAVSRFEAVTEPIDWPSAETSNDDDLFTLATLLFLQPARAKGAKRALRAALGGEKFEFLVGLLTFIRSAHYWTLMHPELVIEDDLTELLRRHEELAGLLCGDKEAEHHEMEARLFEELESLRVITTERRAEIELADAQERQKNLTEELQHRIKNTLAVVGAIANQTMRGDSVEVARSAFTARLVTLSRAHDILTQTSWQSAPIEAVVEGALAPHRMGQGRIKIEGPELLLQPRQALAIALAVHELATNAVKYGSLSKENGRVSIAWSIEIADDVPAFHFVWTETGGPAVLEPRQSQKGFGSRMIERMLKNDFGGEVRIKYEANGLVCELVAPRSNI
jgi:two-component sensor histidine kinase